MLIIFLFIYFFEVILVWWLSLFFSNYFFLFYLLGDFSLIYFFIIYFFFQEFLGFVFVFISRDWIVFLVLRLKRGFGFFFFWVLFLVNLMVGYVFFIFNFLLKIIYIPILIKFIDRAFDWFMIISLLVLFFFQVFFKNSKLLFFLNSRETFVVFFVGFTISLFDVFFIVFLYFLILFLVWVNIIEFLDFEKIFFFLGLPFNLVFFLKSFNLFIVGEKRVFVFFIFLFSFLRIMRQLDFLLETKVNFLKSRFLLGLFYFFFLFLY